jgi:carbon monoxide dehydrogenase subunit G
MPVATSSCVVPVEAAAVWTFVRDYANWASLFPGYQGHVLVGPGVSRWTVRGDVGMFTRIVELEVRIAEEAAARRVRFTVAGLSERLAGEGVFELRRLDRGGSRLALTLDVTAGGPLGPLVNTLLGSRLDVLLGSFSAALSRRLAGDATRDTTPSARDRGSGPMASPT